jgi:transcriptional regulator with GAF, ATPase, and Fis domain
LFAQHGVNDGAAGYRIGVRTGEDDPVDVNNRPHLVEIAAALKEITATIASTLPFPQTIQNVLTTTAGLVPGHIRTGLTLVSQGLPAAYAAPGLPTEIADEANYAAADGPSMESIRTRDVVVSQDLQAEARWPQWTGRARRHGVSAVLAYPFDVDAAMVGALTLYGDRPDSLSDDAATIAMLVADQTSLLLRIRLRQTSQDDLLTQVHQRGDASVERAVGIVMAQRGCTPDKALHHLYDAANHLGVGLAEVAGRLVQTVGDRGVGSAV